MEGKKACPSTPRHAQSSSIFNMRSQRARVCPTRPSRTHQTTPRANPSNSADDEDATSDSLTREFRAYVSEEVHNTNKKHLDLLFEVSASAMTKNRQASEAARTECDACHGTGEVECPYCNGTGALTVGDVLFCDHTGCKKCVVCRNGLIQCGTCRGYGRYAQWMQTK